MSHFKAKKPKIHQIRFPASVRSSVCLCLRWSLTLTARDGAGGDLVGYRPTCGWNRTPAVSFWLVDRTGLSMGSCQRRKN